MQDYPLLHQLQLILFRTQVAASGSGLEGLGARFQEGMAEWPLRVRVRGIRVEIGGWGFRVQGLGCRIESSGFRNSRFVLQEPGAGDPEIFSSVSDLQTFLA